MGGMILSDPLRSVFILSAEKQQADMEPVSSLSWFSLPRALFTCSQAAQQLLLGSPRKQTML